MAGGQDRPETRLDAAFDKISLRLDALDAELRADLSAHAIMVARKASKGKYRVDHAFAPRYIIDWLPVAAERFNLTRAQVVELALRILHKSLSRIDGKDVKLAAKGKL